jgi:hypothetical protein
MGDKANDQKPTVGENYEHIDHICLDDESHDKDNGDLEALESSVSQQVKVTLVATSRP